MTDYISREEARELMYHNQDSLTEYDLNSIPAADVRPVVRGEWKEERMKHIGTGEIRTVRICSVCDAGYFRYDMLDGIVDVVPNFCPNCGALNKEGEG